MQILHFLITLNYIINTLYNELIIGLHIISFFPTFSTFSSQRTVRGSTAALERYAGWSLDVPSACALRTVPTSPLDMRCVGAMGTRTKMSARSWWLAAEVILTWRLCTRGNAKVCCCFSGSTRRVHYFAGKMFRLLLRLNNHFQKEITNVFWTTPN